MRATRTGPVDMAIILPLDVIAGKLQRLEEELQHLSVKALSFDRERESGDLRNLLEPRLERIRDTMSSIRSCLSGLSADIEPTSDNISTTPPDHAFARDFREEDTEVRVGRQDFAYAPRKSKPDRDD